MSRVGLKASRQSRATTNLRCLGCRQRRAGQLCTAHRGAARHCRRVQTWSAAIYLGGELRKFPQKASGSPRNRRHECWSLYSRRTEELKPDGYHILLQVSTAEDGMLKYLPLNILQVNFLSTTYFSLLLLRLLSEGVTPGRPVLVCSEVDAWTSYYALQKADIFRTFGSKDIEYSLSKLFLILFGRELVRHLNHLKSWFSWPIQASVHSACSVIPTDFWQAC